MREFETMSNIARSPMEKERGGEELRSLGRRLQLQMVVNTINRILNQDEMASAELLQALRPSILDIRQQYIDPQLMDHRREVGLGVAPQLGRVYDVILLHFDALRSNPELLRVAGITLRLSEETLKLIDSDLRKGTAITADSTAPWANAQRSVIQENRDVWADILSKAPYDGR
jgi:hypothetical protein